VHEILKRLGPGARVLDLGCFHGSFREGASAATVVRCDLERHAGNRFTRFVQCDARALPFAPRSFDAVILNHSLEHFENPAAALSEVGRISRNPGYVYVAVPNSSTMTDRLYAG
jgi:ubiquinone/menaquinone biosynthesis C-methylase UbiE